MLIPLIVFVFLLYPLLRKAVALLGIYVNRYVQLAQQETECRQEKEQNAAWQTLLNLKIMAHERTVLLVERLKPDSLVPRTVASAETCRAYQLMLMREIRQEFEHNLSQQLYLSDDSWNLAVSFKDQIITIVNTAAAECGPQSTAADLARKILEHYIVSELKAEQVLKVLKADMR